VGYIDQLKADTAEANLRREEEAKANRHNADSRVLCDKPLTEQIEALMRSLSSAQRDRPWSMDELVARLQGRYSARPHPMNVGQALRALGWTQKRDWTRDGGGKRYWVTEPSECPLCTRKRT
jgi:hypothetical protein